MNFLLQIIPQFWKWLTTLPAKNQIQIVMCVILLTSGYLFYDRFLDYKLATFEKPSPSKEIENKIEDTTFGSVLATIEEPTPEKATDEEDMISTPVEETEPRIVNTIVDSAK